MHSRRIGPISRSAKQFCHGERAEIGFNPSLTLARQKDGQASRVLSPGRLLQRSGVLLCAAPAHSFPAATF
jgi:hypothetical protein